jgi:hypothetical protein
MKQTCLILLLVAFTGGCASVDRQKASLPSRALPKPGKTVPHPGEPHVRYYFATGWHKMQDGVRAKDRALYRSRDSGSSWTPLCCHLGFVSLFIHPDTQVLFAVVGENGALRTDAKGILARGVLQKIVMSKDGRTWTDITRGNGNLGHAVVSMAVDSKAPKRIALHLMYTGFDPSGATIRWLDDTYAEWDRTEIPPGEYLKDLFVK